MQEKIPPMEQLPLLPLKDIVIFPKMVLPVFVGEDVCMNVVETALNNDGRLFLSAFQTEFDSPCFSSKGSQELKTSILPPYDVYDVGVTAKILRFRKLANGRAKVLIEGEARGLISRIVQSYPYPIVEYTPLPDLSNHQDSSSLIQKAKHMVKKIEEIGLKIPTDVFMVLEEATDPGHIAHLLSANIHFPMVDAQYILGCTDSFARLQRVVSLLEFMKENMKLERSHSTLHTAESAKNKGVFDMEVQDEMKELYHKLQQLSMPKSAYEETLKQLKRLERMNQDSSEATLTRTYVEWMLDLPWNHYENSPIDMKHCKKSLDENHYGLGKIKDRILEYLAVKKLNPNIKAPILCFVGPPGVGKTSLGKAIAKALSRKFFRISLGGVKDEAEVRGHRRTYVGSQPGRIVQALKQVGTMNPVLMLDEIDKLSSDYKGDPSSALLEVLDPEQNHGFSDHYIHVPMDLSQVIFLANANRLENIPPALKDRLEIIEVSGYTEDEKTEIAKQHILPKTITQHGLNEDFIQFPESIISMVINNYTRESGLRELERQMGHIVRKIARKVAESDEINEPRKPIRMTPKYIRELLGEESYLPCDHNTQVPKTGVSVGLAYTSVGGEILEIEVNLLPSKGGLLITGHLGEVMKESVMAGLSFIRSHAKAFGLLSTIFQEQEIHLHVPAGAIPKDGPSAGSAVTMAILSACSQIPMRQDVAMTGEITIHGRILPVGGLREKILAAQRAGIQTVLIPEKNRGVISELPSSLKDRIEIRFVSHINEVVEFCFPNKFSLREESYGSFCDSSSPMAAASSSSLL